MTMMSLEGSAVKPTASFLHFAVIWTFSCISLVSVTASSHGGSVGDVYHPPRGNSAASYWAGGSTTYSFSKSCLSECSDEVVMTIGDQDALCAMDEFSLSCLDDCFGAGVVDAHCKCNTGALFAPTTFDFLGSQGYCCGNGACQAAVAKTYTALGASSNAEVDVMLSASCTSVKCGSLGSHPSSQETRSESYGSFVSRPTTSLVETVGAVYSKLSESNSSVFSSVGGSMSYSFSTSCLHGCSDEVIGARLVCGFLSPCADLSILSPFLIYCRLPMFPQRKIYCRSPQNSHLR